MFLNNTYFICINFIDSDESDLELINNISSSDTDGESDDEIVLNVLLIKHPRQKIYFQRKHPLVEYEDRDFEIRYRLPKNLTVEIAEMLRPRLEYLDKRNNPIPVIDQVLTALRYYATASFQLVVGDLFGIHQTSCGRIVKRVTIAICEKAKDFIRMPSSPEELRNAKLNFFIKKKFPNVIGVIDGSHIPIISPGKDVGEQYRNRKSFFSINTQVVGDADGKILDIVARWPGSTHDQTIMDFSMIKARLETGEFGDGFLLGDSGYGCKNYLLTPLLNPLTEPQRKFNKVFKSARQSTIECLFGRWKKRFPILSRKMLTNVSFSVICIVAVSVLHNICIDRNLEVPPVEGVPVIIDIEDDVVNDRIPRNQRGPENRVRNEIIRNFFTN